jgi:uncharacterized membrane protein YeaQ/YmgE (transglycosylase-associated protein family)
MGIIEFAAFVVVAAVCGLLGQFLTGYSRGGCPVAFVAGFVGAVGGPWAANQLGWAEPFLVPIGEVNFPLVSSAAGALLLVVIVNLATKKRKF